MREMPAVKKRLYAVPLILTVVALSYFNALSNKFVYDDVFLVVKNPYIKSPHNIPALFTTGYWASIGKTCGLYRPLTMFSFLSEHSIDGLNPFIFHLDNVLLHLLCSILVYLLLYAIIKDVKGPLFAALIFAAHPVHTEAVAWVSGRAELLSAFFSLASSLVFIKRPSGYRNVLLSCFLFLFAVLSKESAAILPLLLGAYLLLFESPQPGQGRLSLLAMRLYPFMVTLFIYLPARFYALGMSITPSGPEQILSGISPYHVFLTMCEALTHYIRLSFLPIGLSAEYLFLNFGPFYQLDVLFPLILVAILLLYMKKLQVFNKASLFGILWFLIALLPVSNIIPVGIVMAERVMYIPSIGPCLLLGLAFSWASSMPGRRRIYYSLLACLIILFSIGTISRNPAWNDQSLFVRHRIEYMSGRVDRYPEYPFFKVLLAAQLITQGEYGPKTELLLKDALRMNPNMYEAHYLMAEFYRHGSKLDLSLGEIKTAIGLYKDSEAFNFAGGVLESLGRYDEAEAMVDEAIKRYPRKADYYLNKAYILLSKGDTDGAFDFFEKSSSLDPNDYEAFLQQGIILGSRHQYTASIEKLGQAAKITPDRPDVHYYLAVAYLGTGSKDKAAAELGKALSLDPGYKDAANLLNSLR